MYIEESPCPEKGSLFTFCSRLWLSHMALLSIYTHTGCGKVSREQGNNLMSWQGPSRCRPGMNAFETTGSLPCLPLSFQRSTSLLSCRQRLRSDGPAP